MYTFLLKRLHTAKGRGKVKFEHPLTYKFALLSSVLCLGWKPLNGETFLEVESAADRPVVGGETGRSSLPKVFQSQNCLIIWRRRRRS